MNPQEFPISVIEKIGYYVYLLIDPEKDNVFYVGKGYGNRIFSHINNDLSDPCDNDKLNKIREIKSKGYDVKHQILRHGLSEKEAFEVEAALIDYIGLPILTNIVQGNDSYTRGRMNVSEIIAIYEAKEIVITEPAILITINRLFERNIGSEQLYEITRGNWAVGKKRNNAKYAFAVFNGIVREVYRILSWHQAYARREDQKIQNRWRFDGEVSEELQHYVGGNVVSYITPGARNPIRYVNCE